MKSTGRSQQERGMRITSTYLQYQLALNIEDCRLKCGDKKAGPLLPGMSGSATISFHFENSPENISVLPAFWFYPNLETNHKVLRFVDLALTGCDNF